MDMQHDRILPSSAIEPNWSVAVDSPAPHRQDRGYASRTMLDDVTLLKAYRSGDDAAFAALAERYQPTIRAACQRQAPSDEADDCTQAVFLVLARRPAAAARAPVLLAWLHQVAVYVCRDARRAAARRSRIVNQITPSPGTGNSPENAVLERLDQALLGLDERQRSAILHHANGTSHDQIALLLGVSLDNANKLVQRGLAALRERLSRSGITVGASMLLAVITANTATGATAPPITIHTLNHVSANASQLAKGSIMHQTLTATSTWLSAACVVAALGVGVLIAGQAQEQQPTPNGTNNPLSTEQIPVPTPIPANPPVASAEKWQQMVEERLQNRVSFDFSDIVLDDVIEFLRKKIGVNIIVHSADFHDASPITMTAKEMTLSAVLRNLKTMSDVNYLLIDQALFIYGSRSKDHLSEIERQLSGSEGNAAETEWGKQIIAVLDKELTVDFQDVVLEDAVAFLREQSKINFFIEPRVVAAGIAPISIKVSSMKLRFLLNHMMRLNGTRYRLQDEAIWILPLETEETP